MVKRLPEKLELPPQQERVQEQEQLGPQSGNIPFLQHIENTKLRASRIVQEEFKQLRVSRIKRLQDLRHSLVIVYYSVDLLDYEDAQWFYEVLNCYPQACNIDLILVSPGGYSAPAFKIARMCQECAENNKGKFSVLVPYTAKSAATILSLGADEIVMGPASELGPIDPQMVNENGGYISLLSLRDAIKFIQDQVKENTDGANLWWPIINQIKLMALGQYEREIESAQQYAEQLLSARMFRDDPNKAKVTASKLVELYKNHGHVIDRKEARDTLNLSIVDATLEEWEQMWQLHKIYNEIIRDVYIKSNGTKTLKIFETANMVRYREIINVKKKNVNVKKFNFEGV